MPNINGWVIPKNIERPVETVYELENKELMMPEENFQIINSFEERSNLISNKSKLSVAARNKIIKRHGSDYLSERTFNHDIALTQMYGPGFWSEVWDVVKPVSKGALIVASVFPPTAPIAAPITLTVGTIGLTAKGLGHVSDNKDLKEFGDDLVEIASDGVTAQGGEAEFISKYRRK